MTDQKGYWCDQVKLLLSMRCTHNRCIKKREKAKHSPTDRKRGT